MDGCHASTCFVHALAVTPGCRAPAQAMLSHIAKFSATTRLCNASKTAIKASKSRKIAARASLSFGRSLAAQSNSYTHPLSKTTYTQKISYVKTVVRRHAGCGMPHDGDENPGVGMERELRAHMNVTNLIIEDTSGTHHCPINFFLLEEHLTSSSHARSL